jgi:threonylcarbamoyladenosine tRNA methylthiotransferase MtaB
MKYSIVTFGCRVNQADSLGFEEGLRQRGGTPASSLEAADLVVVNTCSVTAAADQSARQIIRRLARTNPGARVVVTGCYATRAPDQFAESTNVLRVVSNDEKPRLIPLIAEDAGLNTAERFGSGPGHCGAFVEPGVAGRTAFTMRVQTGCAEGCTYCIIPTTRGAPRSIRIDAVLSEVNRVVGAGFKEIAITGVHLGSYGRDLMPASSLVDLLRALAQDRLKPDATDGSEEVRFRISSLEPMDCSDEIVELVATSGRFAEHFHLPLQHASDRVLAAMRRPYVLRQYSRLVDLIRDRMPAASIGSDVIAGFPGERDEDFDTLSAYLERSPLTHLHVFPYSDRPGTAASVMRGKVPGAVIRDRAARLREIGHRLSLAFQRSQVGLVHRALTLEDGSMAVTGNYLKLRIPPGHSRNEWVQVRMTAAETVMRGDVIPV